MMALFLGLILDMIIGDPEHWTHPVRWIGRSIQKLEKVLYDFQCKRLMGGVLVGCVLGGIGLTIIGVDQLLNEIGWTKVAFIIQIYGFFAGIAFGSCTYCYKSYGTV